MEEQKPRVTAKKYTGECAITTIRIPKDMCRELGRAGRSRSERIGMCLEFALRHMEIEYPKQEKRG